MTMINCTLYSIATNFYPIHQMAMIGYIAATESLGFVAGPATGSALYSIGGYNFIFMAMGSINIIGAILVKLIFSPKVDSI